MCATSESFTDTFPSLQADLLVQGGEDRTMLGQRIDSVYRTVLAQYQLHLEAFQKTGDVKKFLYSLLAPDEIQGN